jgi:hypothetical protein
MQTRTAIALMAFTAGMALVPLSAKALCQQAIYADRGFYDGTMAQVLGRRTSVDDPVAFTHAYQAETPNPVFASLIFAAVAQHNLLFIVGNAQTCPTTGTVLDMGTIIEIFQAP